MAANTQIPRQCSTVVFFILFKTSTHIYIVLFFSCRRELRRLSAGYPVRGCKVRQSPPLVIHVKTRGRRRTNLEDSRLLVKGVLAIEAANAGPDNDRSAEGRDTTGHVHHARPGEVDHTAVEQEVFLAPGGRPPSSPAPVHHDGVDEGRQDERVGDVGVEGHPLGDGSRYDGGRGRSERPLEEPHGVVVANDFTAIHEVGALEEVVGGTNELAWSYTRKLALHDPGEKGMSEPRACLHLW